MSFRKGYSLRTNLLSMKDERASKPDSRADNLTLSDALLMLFTFFASAEVM
jgi:hypothetical protein